MATALGLSACVMTAPNASTTTIEIGAGASLTLPDRPQFEEAVHLSQLITATYDGAPLRVQSELDLGPEVVTAVLSPLGGPPMMTINWSSAGVTVDKDAALPDALDGRRVLADIVLAYWPPAMIQAHLSDGARFEQSGALRRVSAGGVRIIEITTTQQGARETVSLTNFDQNYALTIVSKRPKP